MSMLRVSCTAAIGAAAVSIAFLTAATAYADDYAGQTYGDASKAIKDANKKAVVATRSGDQPTNDKCLVTHSENAPWLKGTNFTPVTDTVLLDLNCNAAVASATKPGNSAASPEGRKAIADEKKNSNNSNKQ